MNIVLDGRRPLKTSCGGALINESSIQNMMKIAMTKTEIKISKIRMRRIEPSGL